ncbi:MAG: ATP-binding protein, partial [Acidimicrobiia bacterium]
MPVPLNLFVDREDELAGVADLLGRHRLVTLTGPAGIGKTRLAVEMATRLRRSELGSPWFVELATIKDEAAVLEAVALVLSIHETPYRTLREAVVARLEPEPVLLVLDNCEHVIAACASEAGFLLEKCPLLHVLATSREPLGVPGEAVCQVPPLSVPSPGEEHDLDALSARDAVRLFIGRADAGRFSLTPAVAPAVAEICRRLDGIPLAIELAASRIGFLTPDQIAARLDDRFQLLTNGQRGTATRHRSLLAALEWSHGLLSEHERRVLRRLSVFSGGCSLDAAEVVCAGQGVEGQDVLDLLGRLAAQSWVICELAGRTARYNFLETIREFAGTKLAASGEEASMRTAHGLWCAALAETAEQPLEGADQAVWLERLEVDHANLCAALDWGLADGEADPALRIAGALVLF